MSLDATRWAWKQNLSPTRKLVLLSLADRADESHVCYPSISRISADTGMYRETIMEAISDMEKSGILFVDRKKGSGSTYRLNGVEGRHDEVITGTKKPTGSKKPTSREKPTGLSGKADRYQSGKADTNLPIESINKPDKGKTSFLPHDFILPDEWIKSVSDKHKKSIALVQIEAENFLEYYTNGKGIKDQKIDWKRAWTTWCNKPYALQESRFTTSQPKQEALRPRRDL